MGAKRKPRKADFIPEWNDEEFLSRSSNNINLLLRVQKLWKINPPEEFLDKHLELKKEAESRGEEYPIKISLNVVLKLKNNLSMKFIKKWCDDFTKVSWIFLMKFQKVDENFLEKHFEDIVESNALHLMLRKQKKLSEEFLDKHFNSFNKPQYVIYFQNHLSEDFILKHYDMHDEFNKKIVCMHQTVSEKFLERFIIGFIPWKRIYKYNRKTVSEEFIKKWNYKNRTNQII